LRIVFQFVAFVLLALWMPATQHCGLEAADLVTAHVEHVGAGNYCEKSTPCSHDGCQIVEELTYKRSGDTLQIPAPDLVACICFVCVHLGDRQLSAEPVIPVVAIDQPIGWVPTWQFARRAAPLSRAPSTLV
jgi:hypothetical protein